jgi:hypothetical protein
LYVSNKIMLRTSRYRQSTNYWGLVQQRGPWDETPIDRARLRESKIYKLGGGVPDGGTEHAGHSIWSTTINPYPQYKNLPPMPNPNTYAQTYNLIPGPPQLPPVTGRPPMYIFTDPNAEKQGTFHQHLTQPQVPTDARPGIPLDPTTLLVRDYQIHRDLVTGPFGHMEDSIESPSFYTSEDHHIPTSAQSSAINAEIPPPYVREPRTSRGPNAPTYAGPNLHISTDRTPPANLTRQSTIATLAQRLNDADVALHIQNDEAFERSIEDIFSITSSLGVDNSDAITAIQHLNQTNPLSPDILRVATELVQQTVLSPDMVIPHTLTSQDDTNSVVIRRPGTTDDVIVNVGFNETTTELPELPEITFEQQCQANSLGINVDLLAKYNEMAKNIKLPPSPVSPVLGKHPYPKNPPEQLLGPPSKSQKQSNAPERIPSVLGKRKHQPPKTSLKSRGVSKKQKPPGSPPPSNLGKRKRYTHNQVIRSKGPRLGPHESELQVTPYTPSPPARPRRHPKPKKPHAGPSTRTRSKTKPISSRTRSKK